MSGLVTFLLLIHRCGFGYRGSWEANMEPVPGIMVGPSEGTGLHNPHPHNGKLGDKYSGDESR